MHTPKRILMIEDNADEAILLRQFKKVQLEKHIKVIRDGGKALDYLTDERFRCEDLAAIFLDLCLPTIDGLKILEVIRSDDRLQKLAVIIMTGANLPGELARCRELGVSSYVGKPLTLSSFAKAFADSFHARRTSAGVVPLTFAGR